MATLDWTHTFLLRALQEDRAALRATSVEARLSHQRLAAHMRRAVAQVTGVLGGGPKDTGR